MSSTSEAFSAFTATDASLDSTVLSFAATPATFTSLASFSTTSGSITLTSGNSTIIVANIDSAAETASSSPLIQTGSTNPGSKSHVLEGVVAGVIVLVLGTAFGIYRVRRRRGVKESLFRRGRNVSMRRYSIESASPPVSMNIGNRMIDTDRATTNTNVPSGYDQHRQYSIQLDNIQNQNGGGTESQSLVNVHDHPSRRSSIPSVSTGLLFQQTTPTTSTSVTYSNPFSDPSPSSRRDPFSDTRSLFSDTSNQTTLPGYTEYESTALDSRSITSDLPPLYENIHTNRV